MIGINKGTIVKNFLEGPSYSLMFIGHVVEINDGLVSLNPCIYGYKIKHQDTYSIYRIDSSCTIIEDLNQAGLLPVEPKDYDKYLDMLCKKPITLDEFSSRLTKALEDFNEQEQQPAEEEF